LLFFHSKITLIPDVREKNESNIFLPKGRLFPGSKFYHGFPRSHHYLDIKNLYEHFLDGCKLTSCILSLPPPRKHTYPCKQVEGDYNYCIRVTCISKSGIIVYLLDLDRSPKAEKLEQTENIGYQSEFLFTSNRHWPVG